MTEESSGRWRQRAAAVWRSAALRVVLLAVVLLLLAPRWGELADSAAALTRGRIQLGDLGGWAQSIGSFAAVWVALAQSRRLRLDRLDDIRRQEVHVRTQVYAWVAYRDEGGGEGGWYVYLNNMTPTPIGVWVLTVRDGASPQVVTTLDVTRLLPILPGLTQRPAGLAPGALLHPVSELEFVDAAGLCWRRAAAGGLERIAEIRLGDQVLASGPAPVAPGRGRRGVGVGDGG
ncbi:hypothetical protein [Kitasatospora sp. NPDC050463]|uniref:hypothetical protein n=1 Tax=Kitasatospora sp. NPDC050463 TaxID=3155786 RepID=UPI0033C7BE6E